MGGVVAAGHPLTAEAGARVLRQGGNAVDAAVAAVLMSFAAESPLTGPGAGGFMLVHTPAGENRLLDFFVAAPGLGAAGARTPVPLQPVEIEFSPEAVQVFNVGPSSCGVPGTLAGVSDALARFGTMELAALAAPAAAAARDGIPLEPMQAYLHRILGPILRGSPECAAGYEPAGRALRAGERLHLPELADLLGRVGAEGPGFVYGGDVGAAVSDWVLERGGLITREDMAGYRVEDREPARSEYGGRLVLTNPPPSSGGILIAYALDLLARLGRGTDPVTLVEVMEHANAARTAEFADGLHADGFLERFLARDALNTASGEVGSRLGSTTHVAVLDTLGGCASVTCSNGSGSGVVVPGTGIHLNNMLGEQDLNPLGFHRHRAGRRIPSMMAPTVVLSGGTPEVVLGSAGSNRIRSAILQTIIGVVDHGLPAQEAVDRPRLHVEAGAVDAEPGVDPAALDRLAAAGRPVKRWRERNLFFGGVQAAARDPENGSLSGGGDPRRGGAALVVD